MDNDSRAPRAPEGSGDMEPEEIRVHWIAVDLIDISDLHERTMWDRPGQTLADLGASMKRDGQIDEVRLRIVVPGRYELTDGARRCRAAKLVGITHLRAIVEDVSDYGVIKRQLAHASGIPLHPIDESRLFARMAADHNLSADQIASETGYDRGLVIRRMKLRDLDERVAEIYAQGQIDDEIALAAARVGALSQQRKIILESIAMQAPREATLVALRRLATRHLSVAPWDLADREVLGEDRAPSCEDCGDRTLAQRELFPDMAPAPTGKRVDDYCANPRCWADKLRATVDLESGKANEAGIPIVPPREIAAMWQAFDPPPGQLRGMVAGSAWADADARPAGELERTVREVLGGEVPHALAIDPDGHPRWLYRASAVAKAAKRDRRETRAAVAAKPTKAEATRAAEVDPVADGRKAERERQAKLEAAELEAVDRVAAIAGELPTDRWLAVLAQLLAKADSYSAEAVAARRGVTVEKLLATDGARRVLTAIVFQSAIGMDLVLDHAKLLGAPGKPAAAAAKVKAPKVGKAPAKAKAPKAKGRR